MAQLLHGKILVYMFVDKSSEFDKSSDFQPATYLKKWAQYRYFPVNSTKILRTPFS